MTATTASASWKWTQDEPWTANAWLESPDLKSVIQEIVNRPGWSSDNVLVVIYTINTVTFGDERRFWSFDGDPAKAAKLVITCQPR